MISIDLISNSLYSKQCIKDVDGFRESSMALCIRIVLLTVWNNVRLMLVQYDTMYLVLIILNGAYKCGRAKPDHNIPESQLERRENTPRREYEKPKFIIPFKM